MQEKYTRTDHDNMQNVVSIDDPKIYTKPYVATTVLWHWNPKQEFEEQLCVPEQPPAPACSTAMAAGEQHACAVRTDGEVWCWGRNESGSFD